MKYTVLGGGLSGLGFFLNEEDSQIFEKSSRIGGHAKSKKFDDYFFDEGAHINHSKSQSWLDFINSKNINYRKSEVKNLRDKNFFGYPIQSNLGHLDKKDRIRYLNSFMQSQVFNSESGVNNYRDWCYATYGEELAVDFYKPFTEKYWRTPMEDLSTDWLKGRLIKSDFKDLLNGAFKVKSEDKTVFNHFRYPREGGFERFFDKNYDFSRINLDHSVTSIDLDDRSIEFNGNKRMTFDTIINSIPIPELVKVTKKAPRSIIKAAEDLKYTSLIQLNVIVQRESCEVTDLTWFYVYDEDKDIARVSIIDNLTSKDHKNKVAFQVEIFRRNDEVYDIGEISRKALGDLCEILNIERSNVIDHETIFVKYAYVISDKNRAKNVEIIKNYYENNEVFSIGLYGKWNYVWSDVAFHSGVEMANNLKSK